MKKVQHAVLNLPDLGSQLINPIAKIVRRRPAKPMALIRKQSEPCSATDRCMPGQAKKPIHEWRTSLAITEGNNL